MALYVRNIEIIYFESFGVEHFILVVKTLTNYTCFFLPDDFEKIDNIILSHFKNE